MQGLPALQHVVLAQQLLMGLMLTLMHCKQCIAKHMLQEVTYLAYEVMGLAMQECATACRTQG